MDTIYGIRLTLEKKVSWVAHFDDLSPLTSELDHASWASFRDGISTNNIYNILDVSI